MIGRALQAASLLILALAVTTWSAPAQSGQPVSSLDATDTPRPTATATIQTAVPTAPVATPAPLPPLELLRIALPRVGIDLPLAPGDIARDVPEGRFRGDTPEGVALVFPGSAALASGGNTYIYAHARVGMFLPLWNVQLNDVVTIYAPSSPGVHLTYTVVRIVPRVDPADTSWLDPAGEERLTLQTSTGPNPNDPRFIAVAVRSSRDQAGSAKP